MMWNDNGLWTWGDWLAMSLMMALVWSVFAAFAMWVTRSVRDAHGRGTLTRPTSTDRADEVLSERFARGEIELEEFRRRRELLHTPDS